MSPKIRWRPLHVSQVAALRGTVPVFPLEANDMHGEPVYVVLDVGYREGGVDKWALVETAPLL